MPTQEDLPPEDYEDYEEGEVQQGGEPIPVMFPDYRKRVAKGRPRNGYEGEVDKIQEALTGIYQAHKDYGEFVIEVKRFNQAENKYKTCGFYQNLMTDNIPSPDTIGKQYGEGKFMLIARFTNTSGKRDVQTFQIDLDQEYSQYRKGKPQPEAQYEAANKPNEATAAVKAVAELAQVAGVGSGSANTMVLDLIKSKDAQLANILEAFKPQQQSFTPADAMAMATKLAEITRPADTLKPSDMVAMIASMNQAKPEGNFIEMFIAMQKAQSEAMNLMMQQQTAQATQTMQMFLGLITAMMGKQPTESLGDKLMITMIPKLIEGKKENTFEMIDKVISLSQRLNPQNNEDDQASKVVDFILPYVPTLLKSTIDAITVRNILKNYPDYNSLMGNPALQEKVVSMLEDKLTPEQLSTVVQKTGIGQADSPMGGDIIPPLPPENTPAEAAPAVVNL